MPNRVIKESLKRSPQIDSLTWFEEVVFCRLIITADDYGCVDGRPIVLKHDLFPTKDSITVAAVKNAVAKLAEQKLVIPYEVDGLPYLYLTTWTRHQRLRKSRHKYPLPEAELFDSISPQIAAKIRELRLESESESEEESDKESERESESETESESVPPKEQTPRSVITLPLCNGETYEVAEEKYRQWTELYPAVDVLQELRKMYGWLDANPKRKKTRQGIERFITGWLAREQDKGRPLPNQETKRSESGGAMSFAERLARRKENGEL